MWITIFLAVFLSLAFFTGCGTEVLAKTPGPSATASAILDPGAVEVGEPLIKPTSPFYFIKIIREQFEEKFGSSERKDKVTRQLEFSQRRLREVNSLIKGNRQDLIEVFMQRYRENITSALLFTGPEDSLKAVVAGALARHLDVLARSYDQVGDPKAKRAIRASFIFAHEKSSGSLAGLKGEDKKDLESKIDNRLVVGCKFLIREASSAALTETESLLLQEKASSCQRSF